MRRFLQHDFASITHIHCEGEEILMCNRQGNGVKYGVTEHGECEGEKDVGVSTRRMVH